MSKDHFASAAIVSLSEKSFDFCENIFEVNFKVHFEPNIKTSNSSNLTLTLMYVKRSSTKVNLFSNEMLLRSSKGKLNPTVHSQTAISLAGM